MADPLTETVTAIAKGFTTIVQPTDTPNGFGISLLGPLGETKGLPTIAETVVSNVLKNVPIDLSVLSKDVRFVNPAITDAATNGGMPIAEPVGGLSAPIASLLAPLTDGSLSPPGVPGLLGGLTGTIPMLVPEQVTNALQLDIQVKWSVQDETGQPVRDFAWQLDGDTDSQGPVPFLFDRAFSTLLLTFTALIGEMTALNQVALPAMRTVTASLCVTAKAAGVFKATSGWIDLPPVTLPITAVLIPTVALLFRHADYKGDVVIAVPGNSPIEKTTATDQLRTLGNTLALASTVLTVLDTLVGGLETIRDALGQVGRVGFHKRDDCGDLSDVTFEDRSLTTWFPDHANDEISSVLMIGPPGRRIDFFNDKDFATGEGQLGLALYDHLFVQLNDMTDGTANRPVTIPPGCSHVVHGPGGHNWGHHVTGFNDEISGFRFSWY